MAAGGCSWNSGGLLWEQLGIASSGGCPRRRCPPRIQSPPHRSGAVRLLPSSSCRRVLAVLASNAAEHQPHATRSCRRCPRCRSAAIILVSDLTGRHSSPIAREGWRATTARIFDGLRRRESRVSSESSRAADGLNGAVGFLDTIMVGGWTGWRCGWQAEFTAMAAQCLQFASVLGSVPSVVVDGVVCLVGIVVSCGRSTPMVVTADSGKHGGSTGGSPYNMSSLGRCWRCSAVLDTGAHVPTDGLKPPMPDGPGLLWRLQ